MNNSDSNAKAAARRRVRDSIFKIGTVMLLVTLVVMVGISLTLPVPSSPTATEIAEAVNGPAEFQRPSAMEYVPKTDSCVVGGTIVSVMWHNGLEDFEVGSVDSNDVGYTTYQFMSDEGRTFNVSYNSALYSFPGENLGLELYCDPATMDSDDSFGMLAIIWGGM